jgi:hypothetical protein
VKPTEAALASVAATVGATDLLVFRRVGGDRYRNVGGTGRGAQWAAAAVLVAADEPLARAALAAGMPRRVTRARLNRLAGPYFASAGALVPVGPDDLVVFGPHLPAEISEHALLAAAERASALVVPALRPGGEPETLRALRTLTEVEPADLAAVAGRVVAVATDSLECELGVLYVPHTGTLACCRRGRPLPEESEVAAVMEALAAEPKRLPLCCQDAGREPLPTPLGAAAGVRSYLALGIDAPGRAILLAMHTEAAPRGFTTVCLERAQRLAEAAAPLLRVGFARERTSA